MTVTVKQRLVEKRRKTKASLASQIKEQYAPEMRVPEDELRAIGKLIVQMGMTDKPLNFAVLKSMILKLRASNKAAKLSARIDAREYEAALEGQMWLHGMSAELKSTYEAMGYKKEKTPYGYVFRKTN